MCCERVVPYMYVDTRRPRVLLHPCRNDVAGPGLIKGMKQSFLKPFAHTCPLAKMSPITATARECPLPASRARPLCLVSSRCVLHLHVTRRRELAYPQRKVLVRTKKFRISFFTNPIFIPSSRTKKS